MHAVPALIVVLIAYGPRVFGLQRRTFAVAFAAAVVGVTLVFLPSQAYRPEVVVDRLVAPVTERRDERALEAPGEPARRLCRSSSGRCGAA